MADDFDPFKSGLAVPVSTSRPVFNATSTAAAPKAPKDFDPFESGAATPVDDSSFNPFASGKADDLDPEAIHARELNDPNFNPSTEQLQALYSAEQKKSFGSQVVEGAKSAIVAPVTAAAKVPGEQIGLAKNLVTRLGETSVPVEGQTATDAVARNAVPVLDYLGKEASTALDAASQFGTSVGGFAMKPVKMAGELLKDYWDADVNGEIPKGESFEDWSQKYLTNLALSRSSNSAEFQKLITSAPGFEPAPNTASTLSTAAQLAMMKAPALGASGEAALAAGKTGLVDQAIKNAGAPVPLTSAETIANGAGTVIDKAGTIARAVGGAPRKLAQAALALVIGDDAAASVTKMGEVAAAHNPVVQGLLATEGVGAGAQRVGQAVTAIAGTPAAGPFGRLVNLAKSADTPGWLKNLASNPAVRTLYGAASDASAMTGSAVKGIAKGAATGAAYGVVSGDSPEELGSDISTFGAFGAAHAGGALKERAFQRRAAGVMDLVGKNLAAGVDPATLAKVPDAAMLAAADIPYLGIKDAQGRDLQVQFLDKTGMAAHGQPSADGLYDYGSHTIFLNADNLANNKGSWSSVFHELLHPLMESEIANRPELAKQIDDAVAANGKTLADAKVAYVHSLLEPELNAAGITAPADVAAKVQERIAQLDTKAASSTGDADHWIRSEILADAGRDALATDKGITSPEGALSAALKPSALGAIRGVLEKLGVKFTPDTANVHTIIPGFQDVVSDPSLRKTVFRLLKAQRDFTPGVSKGAEQSAPLTAADMGTPKAPWHQLANGRLGNKYSEAVPDGKGGVKTVMRNPRQVKKLELAEAKAIKKYVQPGQRLSDLPAAFYADPNIGEWTKQAAQAAAKSVRSGEPLEAWYHGVGKSGEADWKGSVRKMLGNVTASRQNFYVMPDGMFVSKAGNPLMNVFSLSGLERKAQAWMNRKGPLSLDLWNGDINKFRADVNTYNQNHAAGIPGESNNLGVDKKNVINAFLYGRNAKFEANNPLRTSLRSAEDRQGIVRSLRLDRLETLEPGKSDLTRPDYLKGVKNFSPEASAQKSVDDAAKEERPAVAPNLGGGESALTPEQQALSRKNNSREAFEALNKGKLPGAQFSPKARIKMPGKPEKNPGLDSGWLSPSGEFYKLSLKRGVNGFITHETMANAAITEPSSKGSSPVLYEQGWKRVVPYGSDSLMANSDPGSPELTLKQKKALQDQAITAGVSHVTYDNQIDAPLVIWSSDQAFSPKAKLKLEDAVGDKEIPVIHFSSKSGLTSVDPEFFGKGRANRNDTNGSKKSFFFVKGSKLGGDEPIFGQGGFTKHEGVVDGNKIYDLSANKPDPLGYFDTLNREKADSNVKAADYDGILVGTSDGRKVVMMFKPVKVKAGGAFKGNKAYSPEAQLKTRTPNEDVRKVAADYVASAGIPSAPHQGYAPINEAVSRKVADFYDEAKHDPENPAVKASYDALKNETAAQYKAAEAAGMKFEPWTGEGQPYKNSAEMTADVRDNKHLWYFPTEGGYGQGEEISKHPLLEPSGIKVGDKDIPVNDVFRAVHDYFGHAKEGYEFGPRGELNAFLSHAQMYSDAAKPAMAMETMGQNSWVNFGKHLRDSEGKIPAKGETGYVPVTERPYAEQKANVLPPETLADNKAFSPRAETRDSDETEKFYSQLGRVVDSKFSGEQMPAAQLAALLRNPQNGVKPDELKWTGLDDFLKGKGKITKSEVQDFLKANAVQVKEIIKGGKLISNLEVEKTDRGWVVVQDDKQVKIIRSSPFEDRSDALDHLRKMEAEMGQLHDPDTKYEDHTLPGGENYRETLFTLPAPELPTRSRFSLFTDKGELIAEGDTKAKTRWEHEENQLKRGYTIKEEQVPDTSKIVKSGAFRSPHWDEPNVIAHTRLNDRVDSDGRPGLFAEELQSDWHQKGRKEGYATPDAKEELKSIVERIEDAASRKAGINATLRTAAENDDSPLTEKLKLKKIRVENELSELQALRVSALQRSSGVPDAPFKTTWHETVFRRLLQMATEQGKEWLGWTTGDQQNERYDLSKHISQVTLQKAGSFETGPHYLTAHDLNGRRVIDKMVKPEEVEDYIGKEAAQKLLSQEWKPYRAEANNGDMVTQDSKSLKGLDLKVGGEGMKGFYDKILVDYANKFGKKFGVKVEDRNIGALKKAVVTPLFARSIFEVTTPEGVKQRFSTQENAQKYADKINEELQGGDSVHSLPINDAMRDSLKTGVALFSPKAELKDTERFAKRISSLTEKTGGTTFNIAKGRPIGKNKNFGVSIYPDRSVVLAPKDLTPEVVQKFITDNSDLLSNPENNVGTWFDKASGKVYLDVSVGFANRKLAEYAGKKYNQKAIWDSEKSEEIDTGGNGEAIKDMAPAADRINTLRATASAR